LNRYEMVNIIDVHWNDGEAPAAQKLISEEIVKAGGTVEDIGSMGRRKLAYPINRHIDGLYLVSHFTHSPEGLVPLRDSLKLNPAVIRTLLVRYKGQPGFTLREEEATGEEPGPGGEENPEEPVAKVETENTDREEEEHRPGRIQES